MLVEDNLDLLHGYDIGKIVTNPPHCYDTFKNNYPDNEIEVQYYIQFVT